eukprot:scpid98680/ scgid15273/ 
MISTDMQQQAAHHATNDYPHHHSRQSQQDEQVQVSSHMLKPPTTSLPKPILLPETFGSQPGQDFVNNYMSHFDNACALLGYTHEQCLRLLPARLVGVPHEMLTDIVTNSPNITYREAVEALRARLEPPQLALMHEATLRQRMK